VLFVLDEDENMTDKKKSGCRHIRTRMSYGPGIGDFGDWRTDKGSSNQYWCLKTMTTAGPDNDFVAPETCQPDRGCFENDL
jgi:hypothetical protein